MIQFKQNNKSQNIPTGTPGGAKIKQISPSGVSGETITEIPNRKQDISKHLLFRSLVFCIWLLFVI